LDYRSIQREGEHTETIYRLFKEEFNKKNKKTGEDDEPGKRWKKKQGKGGSKSSGGADGST